ncbi:MAG: hypothetical protein WDW36_005327 [Sanguina aurantia]
MARKRREKKPFHKQSLEQQIEEPETQRVKPISAKLSGRILKQAREQQHEIDHEELEGDRDILQGEISSGALAAALKRVADSDDDDDDEDPQEGDDMGWLNSMNEGGYGMGADIAVSAEEERALAAFMAPDAAAAASSGVAALSGLMLGGAFSLGGGGGGAGPSASLPREESEREGAGGAGADKRTAPQSLGDLILDKIRAKQVDQGLPILTHEGEEPAPPASVLEDKVLAVYKAVGVLLSRYSSGKVPKAFKIIPNLRNWEEVLFMTEPDNWSVQAVFQATRLFVSNLNARLAQRFLALVLLPRVRREIREHHKLHFALFQALKKATYKPGAFFKGILLPLCQTRTCTLREAVILSSVLQRVSIPVLHSAAALLRLAELEYCGTTSFFIRVLLDKKYALPYRVIDSLVDHFVRFADDERVMPVVWHQTLLCFVQRYKDEVRATDKSALRKLCNIQCHKQVTPEVVRELEHGKGREAKRAAGATSAMEVTVMARIGATVAESVKDMPKVLMMEDD